MIKKNKVAILIPAYNPSEDLIDFAIKLSNEFKIIIIDDGSESKNIFDKLDSVRGIYIVTHRDNLGKGAALKTGFKYILQNLSEQELIVTVDADGQHSISDTLIVLDHFNILNRGITVGSRKFGTDTPLKSKIGNYITRYIFWHLTGVKLNDTQTGLRVFPVNLLKHLVNLEGNQFEFELEVLLWCAENNVGIDEVQINAIYFNKNEKTNFRPIVDSLRVYKVLLSFIFNKRRFQSVPELGNNLETK